MRAILGSVEIRRGDLLSMTTEIGMAMKYVNNMEYREVYAERGRLLASLALSSYVPFGKAGLEYAKKKLGIENFAEYQYRSALSNGKIDRVFLNDEEKAELKEIFYRFYDDKVKDDFAGVVLTFIRAAIARYELKYSDWLSLVAANTLADEEVEKSGIIDLTKHIPKVPEAELDDEKRFYIDAVLYRWKTSEVFDFDLSDEEYARLMHGELDGIIISDPERLAEADCKIELKWTSLVAEAVATEVVRYRSVKDIDETLCRGCLIRSGEGSDVALIRFKRCTAARLYLGLYHLEYDSRILGDLANGDLFNLIIKDATIYEPLYVYDKFILTDKVTGRRIGAQGKEYSSTHNSKSSLMKVYKPHLPSNVTEADIDALGEEDWKRGVNYIHARFEGDIE